MGTASNVFKIAADLTLLCQVLLFQFFLLSLFVWLVRWVRLGPLYLIFGLDSAWGAEISLQLAFGYLRVHVETGRPHKHPILDLLINRWIQHQSPLLKRLSTWLGCLAERTLSSQASRILLGDECIFQSFLLGVAVLEGRKRPLDIVIPT